ncbi:MAG TPA: sodium:solute symporter, partial [Bacteroidia bacterium]|nr:sodium:solute symporter [Bacteroidia bacterium]
SLVYSVYIICRQLDLSAMAMFEKIFSSEYAGIVVHDIKSGNYFWKNFLGGAAIAIAMTGLDQEMMQKNLSCKNIGEAKKNMFTFSMILVAVNFLFLILGAVLIFYAQQKNITIDAKHTDDLFPTVALQYLGTIPALIFIIGLISAAYPSADGALTALTTAYCFDFLGIQKNNKLSENQRKRIRYTVHISMAVVLLLTIVVFRLINNDAVIRNVFRAASYTYGPLLGLYAFGFFTRWQIRDTYVWVVCAASPVICYFLYDWVPQVFDGYKFGFELLIVNGLITFLGLTLLIKPAKHVQ